MTQLMALEGMGVRICLPTVQSSSSLGEYTSSIQPNGSSSFPFVFWKSALLSVVQPPAVTFLFEDRAPREGGISMKEQIKQHDSAH